MSAEHEKHKVWRYRDGSPAEVVRDDVAREEPLEIRVAGRSIGVTMRTPGHDDELALGFLVGEGVISGPADVRHVRRCDRAAGDSIEVLLDERVRVDFARLTRHVFASSSCGVCGATTIEAVRGLFPPVAEGLRVARGVVAGMPEALRSHQTTFDLTGGLHGAALFRAHGELVVAREDVGRHNAVDKVIGHMMRAGVWPLADLMLMVSGRVSFEIVQKALAAGVQMVAAVSAPSTLAVELAEEGNLTLVGFLRPGRFNAYTHVHRITE